MFFNVTEYCNAKCIINYFTNNRKNALLNYFNQLYMVRLVNSLYIEISREGLIQIYFK